jgi:hypothetical protein
MACSYCRKRTCRPGRPLCKRRRPTPCQCGLYHYPHRPGSGLCGRSDLAWCALYEALERASRPRHLYGVE